MYFKATLIIFYAAVALARATDPSLAESDPLSIRAPVQDNFPGEDHIANLEKRKGCSGNRLNYEVCQGGFIAKMNSFHNCLNANGHCCARNKNRDYGITVSNGAQGREDCGYCFSGNCKTEKH